MHLFVIDSKLIDSHIFYSKIFTRLFPPLQASPAGNTLMYSSVHHVFLHSYIVCTRGANGLGRGPIVREANGLGPMVLGANRPYQSIWTSLPDVRGGRS